MKWRKVLINGWEKFPLGDVPRRPGLYAIHLYGHGVVYVGQSTVDISMRVAQRVKPCGNGLWTCGEGVAVPVYCIWLTVSPRFNRGLNEAEQRLIRRLNPRFNALHRTGQPAWELCSERYAATC
jgi:excinuclease UvrABC nuclease subunit